MEAIATGPVGEAGRRKNVRDLLLWVSMRPAVVVSRLVLVLGRGGDGLRGWDADDGYGGGGAAGTSTVNHYVAAGSAQPHTPQTATITNGANTSTATYVYDAAGNTATRPAPDNSAQTLAWDSENHLASVTTDGKTSSYVYDTGGNLLISKDPTGSTLFLPSGEIHVSTTGAATGTRYYSAGSASGAATLAVRTNAGLEYQFSDPHGTSTLSIDAGTLASTQRRYDPFGNLRQNPAPTAWPDDKGFVNGVVDSTNGLVRLGARDYDPAAGRFVSADPLLNPGDPAHLNAYTYAENNPTTNSDPSGLYTVGMGCPDRDCHDTGAAPSPSAPPPPPAPRPPHVGDGNRFHCPDGSCNPNFNLAPGLKHVPLHLPQVCVIGDQACGLFHPTWRKVTTPPTVPWYDVCDPIAILKGWGCVTDLTAPPPPKHQPPTHWMFGWCVNGTLVVGAGGVGSGCVVIDDKGVGLMGSLGAGAGPGATASLTTGPIFSGSDLEDQKGWFVYGNGGVRAGVDFDGTVSVSPDGKVQTYQLSGGGSFGVLPFSSGVSDTRVLRLWSW